MRSKANQKPKAIQRHISHLYQQYHCNRNRKNLPRKFYEFQFFSLPFGTSKLTVFRLPYNCYNGIFVQTPVIHQPACLKKLNRIAKRYQKLKQEFSSLISTFVSPFPKTPKPEI
jgi:hypothetical protein